MSVNVSFEFLLAGADPNGEWDVSPYWTIAGIPEHLHGSELLEYVRARLVEDKPGRTIRNVCILG